MGLLMAGSTRRRRFPRGSIGSLALVAGLVLSGCGDPFYSIAVRNDSDFQIVIAISYDDPTGEEVNDLPGEDVASVSVGFLAQPHEVGGTVSGGGYFHGRIAILEVASCRVLGELRVDGGAFRVAVSATGVPEFIKFPSAPLAGPTLPTTTLCGVGT